MHPKVCFYNFRWINFGTKNPERRIIILNSASQRPKVNYAYCLYPIARRVNGYFLRPLLRLCSSKERRQIIERSIMPQEFSRLKCELDKKIIRTCVCVITYSLFPLALPPDARSKYPSQRYCPRTARKRNRAVRP